MLFFFVFLKIFWRTLLFVGPLIPLFWTYSDISSWWRCTLHIPWGSPLVQHLPTSQQPAWQLSLSLPHTCKQALVGLKTGTYHATGERSTDWAIPAQLYIQSDSFWVLCDSRSFNFPTKLLTKLTNVIHWVPLTTNNLIHKNVLAISGTCYIRIFQSQAFFSERKIYS